MSGHLSTQFSHGYALLIGINKSRSLELPPLPVAYKDIKLLEAALTNPHGCAYAKHPKDVRLVMGTRAKRSNVLEGLDWLRGKAQADPEAVIMIYYSGHGLLQPKTQQFYLQTYDAKLQDLDHTALSEPVFTAAIAAILTDRLLVVIDSCHGAGMATIQPNADPKALNGYKLSGASRDCIQNLKNQTGRVIFTAASGQEFSWDRSDGLNGIYTYHFLQALQGIHNRPGDREVKVSDIQGYLSRVVPEITYQQLNKIQTPQFHMVGADFAVAKLRGGKGLPDQSSQTIEDQIEQRIKEWQQQLLSDSQIEGFLEKSGRGQYVENDRCQDQEQLEKYFATIRANLRQEGCVDIRHNLVYQGQKFDYIARIVDFEIPFAFMLNMRGDAFFMFAQFPTIKPQGLRQFSSRCLQWAKDQVKTKTAMNAIYNMRLPCHNCFSIAVVDELDDRTGQHIRKTNPFYHKVDGMWYEIPVVYELKRQQLFYYVEARNFADQMTGEVVWKKLREIIETMLSA
jgi:uncharacterized caspase-like protein